MDNITIKSMLGTPNYDNEGNSNLTKVCCQQSEYLNHFLTELWECNPYYNDGCYQKIDDQ